LINGVLVLLERYQNSVDQAAVGEGPDANVVLPL